MVSSDKRRGVRLGQLLLERGALTQEQLDQALAHQKQNRNTLLLGEVLQQLGFCTEEQIMEALARATACRSRGSRPKVADPKVIDLLPREFLDKHNVLPLFKVRNRLTWR